MLIKYIKSVLWRVAKRLSYIEDARYLKVKIHVIQIMEFFYASKCGMVFVKTDLLQGFEILGFCCGVVKVFALLECCMMLLGSLLLMLQDSFFVPFARVKQSKKNAEAGGCMNV